jgi:hypothetical protein
MNLLPEEKQAFDLLKNIGLKVKPVPTGKLKSPEFIVDGDDCGYVVEVKARRNSAKWKKSLREGGVALESRAIGYGRWADDVSRNALKQLRAIDQQHLRWWVIWFSIECQASGESMFQQAIGSLFGVRQIVDRSSESMWDCIYATPGVFERHNEIVAAVVTQGKSITFCVNELAGDFNSFSASVLCKHFESLDTIISATDLTKNRSFLYVDPREVDRKSEEALSTYLGRKYNFEAPIILDMKEHVATARVPKK